MERLTKTMRCQDGARLYDISNELFGLNISRADKTRMILEKLAEYEDLEEQGRLLKLPCKIGDDVYFVPSKVNYKLNILNKHSENNKVYHQKVEDFVLTRHGWYLECDQDVKYGTGYILTDVSFCKTWFLTKPEAEAKLKELRGSND